MKRIEDTHPPLSDSLQHKVGQRFIARTDSDDRARAAEVDRLCHCHPVTEQELRREIADLAREYHRVDRVWLQVQLRAWELAWTSSAGLMERNGRATAVGHQRDEILGKLSAKCGALGMRTRK